MKTSGNALVDIGADALDVMHAGRRRDVEPVLSVQEFPANGRLGGQALGDFLSLAYDVALGSANWNELASHLSGVFGCNLLYIFVQGASPDSTEMLGFVGKGVANHFGPTAKMARDWARSVEGRGLSASAVSNGTVLASGGIGRWDALVPGTPCYVIGERLASTAEEYVCIGCSATNGEQTPSQATRNKFGVVLPHLARAAQIDRRLRTAAAQSFANDAILDRLPFGLFQLDSKGLVISANARAQGITQLRKGLTVTPTGVHATVPGEEMRLQKAIAEVLAGGGSRRVSVKRGLDERPYAILVSSIARYGVGLSQRTACVVFVTDPEGQSSPSAEAIAESFGLTPAEARVVCGLVMGVSLQDTATRLGISINTARTLLARAMARTGTNSQITLVRMVLTGLSLVQRDE